MRLDLVLKMSLILSLFPLIAKANETLSRPLKVSRAPAIVEIIEPDLEDMKMDLTSKDLPGYTDEELAGIQEVLEKAEADTESDVE